MQATHRRFMVREPEDVGAARRAVSEDAINRGLQQGVSELVMTELGTNLLRHGGGGELLFRPIDQGIEVVALDRGPGMSPVALALSASLEAHSGALRDPGAQGGLGVGLAGIRHLASDFDLYSELDRGTVVLVRLRASESCKRPQLLVNGLSVAVQGETSSGDAWCFVASRTLSGVVVDGMGHGVEAGVSVMGAQGVGDLADFVRVAHEAMRPTRGGALSVFSVDPELDEISYAGVGNVAGRLLIDGKSRSMLTYDGALGVALEPPKVTVLTYPWPPGAILVLATDGLRSGWDPKQYQALFDHDPVLVAAVLLRDHEHGNDDVTVVVVRDTRGSS